MPKEVCDETAERLEAAGLWRRAAARWLAVMPSSVLTEEQREWVRDRRAYCQAQVMPVVPPEKLDIAELFWAATATQERMGIRKLNGGTIRAYPPLKSKTKRSE